MSGLRRLGPLLAIVAVCNALLAAGTLQPLSEADKEAARQLFVARDDGSFGSLQETYEAVRSMQALKSADYDSVKISSWVFETLTSSSPDTKDIFYGLRTIELLHGKEGAAVAAAVTPKVLAAVKESQSLLDLYFSVGALATIKKQHWSEDSHHVFAPALSGVLPRIKALGEDHGTWRYAEDQTDSSAKAAGFAFDITAGVVEIAGLEGHKSEAAVLDGSYKLWCFGFGLDKIDPSIARRQLRCSVVFGVSTIATSNYDSFRIRLMKAAVGKLLENIELYDDGAQYFDESKADKFTGSGGALSASALILRGIAALASVLPDGLKVKEDKLFGLAKFFLSIGTPNSATEAYYQLDALSILEDNRLIIPLAVHLPTSVLSLTSHDSLEVAVTTLLGSPGPEVVVTLISAHELGKEGSPILTDQKLVVVNGGYKYSLDFLSKSTDLGKYDLKLEVKPVSAEHLHRYSAGGLTVVHIVTTGVVSVSNLELAVLDSDTGSPESVSSLDITKKNKANLSANHLQKLHLTFELTSPSGGTCHPQQVFFKLRHDSGVEQLFVVRPSGKLFELTLDFLGLLEKLYYLSGTYTTELIIGDVTMENSFLWALGSLDLDLPEAPEGAVKPPSVPVAVSLKYEPKTEIAHIFRQPEKRPGAELSYAFLVLTLLPLVGFFAGLPFVGANVKNFPTSGLQLLAAFGFHIGVAAILTLYFLFWLKLNLFTTLKALGMLGLFTCLTGHSILSYLSDLSSKVKTA